MQITTVEFDQMGFRKTLYAKHVVWHFKNNLDEHGLDIFAAFTNWAAREPKEVTKKAFCEYVLSKNVEGLICKPTQNKG